MLKTISVCIASIYCIASVLGQTLQSQYCYNASQCVGTEWVFMSDSQIYGFAYKSLFGPSTSITANNQFNDHDVYCSGAFACEQISFINNANSVHCGGSHACANINGLSYINAEYVGCIGSNACQNSNIIASSNVECEGSQSCIYTNISTPYVYGSGTYSLYASVIDSQSVTDSLNVVFDGYQSGFGATVICRAGDICNIYCKNNGCEMLYVECEQNSDCNILLNNNDASITIPPITDVNEYDYTLYDIKYDTQILSVSNNELCNEASNFVYDIYNFLDFGNVSVIEINEQNTEPVCCRAYQSCQNTPSITFTDIVSDIVVCSGWASCEYTFIDSAKSVFCEGHRSCKHTNITKANNLYCLGWLACSDSEITQSTNVYCLGSESCESAMIQSNGNDINIYLFGHYSGYYSGYSRYTNIYCDSGDKCRIYCGGYESCSGTTVHCNNNCFVDCNTDTGCPRWISQSPTRSPTATVMIDSPTYSPTANVAIDQSTGTMPNAIRTLIGFLFISMYIL